MFGKRRIVGYVGVIIVLLFGMLAVTRFAQAESSNNPKNLVGAWIAELQLEAGPIEGAMVTFFSDGIVVEDEIGTGESSGHGVWVMDKDGQVRFTVVELLWNASDDTPTGKLVIKQTLTRDAATDTWSGPSVVTAYDLTGAVLFTASPPVKLTRINLEYVP